MEHIKLFEEFSQELLNEAKSAKVQDKDYKRMMKLVLTDDTGSKALSAIKDKNKAMQRYVAGLKLKGGTEVKYEQRKSGSYSFSGPFWQFAELAIDLGATPEEIVELFDNTEVPQKYFDEMAKKGGKKLDSWVVGAISQLILDMGYDIEYLPHNGYALTSEGQWAMEQSGLKWTIGYKTLIDLGDRKVKFNFDAITDESVDRKPVYYVKAHNTDEMFNQFSGYKRTGIRELKQLIKAALENPEQN